MIGSQLAHYRITAALGAGGMGEVWRTTDIRLGREVALKVLPEAFASDPDRLARFEREAKVLASLNHPNIAHLYGLETVKSGANADSDADAGTLQNSILKTQNSKLTSGADAGPRPQAPGPLPRPAAGTAAPQNGPASPVGLVGHASRVPGGGGGVE